VFSAEFAQILPTPEEAHFLIVIYLDLNSHSGLQHFM
jgi:hypothetical protein